MQKSDRLRVTRVFTLRQHDPFRVFGEYSCLQYCNVLPASGQTLRLYTELFINTTTVYWTETNTEQGEVNATLKVLCGP